MIDNEIVRHIMCMTQTLADRSLVGFISTTVLEYFGLVLVVELSFFCSLRFRHIENANIGILDLESSKNFPALHQSALLHDS